MNITRLFKRIFVVLLCSLLVGFTAQAEAYGSIGQSNDQPQASPAKLSPQELQQLVAPIALYPDALVAQILAASTYPTQIVDGLPTPKSCVPCHGIHGPEDHLS